MTVLAPTQTWSPMVIRCFADERAAGHAEVVSDGELGAGAAGADDDGMVGAERVAVRGGAQVQVLADADGAAAVALDDRQAIAAPA